MKIYFAGAIRGGRDDQETYAAIIDTLGAYGTVLTEHLGERTLSSDGEARPDTAVFMRDIAWVEAADILIAEVTTPSLGVGYEIGHAVNAGKEVLCLFRTTAGKKLSFMISGNPHVRVVSYASIHELAAFFEDYFSKKRAL